MQQVKRLNEANKAKFVAKAPPRVRPARLPPAMLEVTRRFKKEYTPQQLELLWGALLEVYGDAELAAAAVRSNPQVLNPSYSFCNTMLASREALEAMMGREEALDVMLKNPAVLQCGPSLETLGPAEIKGFAAMRAAGNALFPEGVRGPALLALLAFCAFPVVASYVPELEGSWALGVAKPAVGLLFAVAIEGSRLLIVGTVLKAKMAGDERERRAMEKADAARRRRMGKK
ncbi:hypothetical protein AB1Y20_014325 [Prymnesium parvum]|uniref:Uncharacterized protein n=1 Tax=Prymnesium parvum TaxID=97485 RepID=A0AB34IDZ8_PRYPA|mmetsp:Transcript_6977/g.17447  ORF Transcript_6977/g.17447 Transcript_6977/m.17447 type:complete len:231 (-) Transcript_6977:241-933(-)